jgi:hypothetical protein
MSLLAEVPARRGAKSQISALGEQPELGDFK